MKNVIKTLFLAVFVAAFFSACQKETLEVETGLQSVITLKTSGTASFGTPQPSYPVTFEGVVPKAFAGNFVASDNDQVCYELEAIGYIKDFTGELRGGKVDLPGNNTDSNMDILLSGDGRYLAWATPSNVTALAFVIKGGNNYHVYDYVGSGFDADSWLASPLQARRIPAISHYNFCYTVTPDDFEGCTPGYWRNHADRWFGYTTDQVFDGVFGVTFLGTATLGMVINAPQTYGTFGFHAVAALLNSTGGVPNADGTTVNYPLTTAEVIALVQEAVANGTTESAKDILAGYNELGCPLSGTRAVKV